MDSFQKNDKLISYLRLHTKARWSQTQKSWYVSDNKHHRNLFHIPTTIVGKRVLSKINPINQKALTLLQDQIILKGYAENTLRTYTIEFAQLLYVLKSFPVNELTTENSEVTFCIAIRS